MDAVHLLNQHIDIEKIMNHYDFDRMRPDGKMIRACCKVHGGSNPDAFVANTENNLWFCHTGCQSGGDVYTLIQHIEGCGFTQSVRVAASILGIDIEGMQIVEQKEAYVNELQKWMKTMKSRKKKVEHGEFILDVPMRDIQKFRNFNLETIRHFGMKYIEELEVQKSGLDSYKVSQRLVIPIHDKERLVGYSLRRIRNKDKPKWLHIPTGIRTGELLYNIRHNLGQRSVVLCEGMFDVWAYHEINVGAVATYGAHCSEEQYRTLIREGFGEVTLSYDGDVAGVLATKKITELLRNKVNLYVVHFGLDEDPESITREELKKRYDGRKRIC